MKMLVMGRQVREDENQRSEGEEFEVVLPSDGVESLHDDDDWETTDYDDEDGSGARVSPPLKTISIKDASVQRSNTVPCAVERSEEIINVNASCSHGGDDDGDDDGGDSQRASHTFEAQRASIEGTVGDMAEHEVLANALNVAGGAMLDQFAMALRQVCTPMSQADWNPLMKYLGTNIRSKQDLQEKRVYTWYPGYDVVHGLSYVHPLVMKSFVPVHPLYYDVSPRVKYMNPEEKLPRLDPTNDNYVRAAIQYARVAAGLAGNLWDPPIQVHRVIARQYDQFEVMLDRIVHLRKCLSGSTRGHKYVRVRRMTGDQSLLLTPKLFSPRHIIIGTDPAHVISEELEHPRNQVVPLVSSLRDIGVSESSYVEHPAADELQLSPIKKNPVVCLYDKNPGGNQLVERKSAHAMTDFLPPYPLSAECTLWQGIHGNGHASTAAMQAHHDINSVTGTAPGSSMASPTNDIPLSAQGTNGPKLRRGRSLSQLAEKTMRVEKDHTERHRSVQMANSRIGSMMRSALDWCRDSARLPLAQSTKPSIVIERLDRATQINRMLSTLKSDGMERAMSAYFGSAEALCAQVWTHEDHMEKGWTNDQDQMAAKDNSKGRGKTVENGTKVHQASKLPSSEMYDGHQLPINRRGIEVLWNFTTAASSTIRGMLHPDSRACGNETALGNTQRLLASRKRAHGGEGGQPYSKSPRTVQATQATAAPPGASLIPFDEKNTGMTNYLASPGPRLQSMTDPMRSSAHNQGIKTGTLTSLRRLSKEQFMDLLENVSIDLCGKFRTPKYAREELDLHKLFWLVMESGGYKNVVAEKKWRSIATRIHSTVSTSCSTVLRRHYEACLLNFENYLRRGQ